MKKETSNNYLTVEEVTEHLKITRRTAYNYIKSGALKSYRVGRQYRVKETDLNDFIRPTPGRKSRKAI